MSKAHKLYNPINIQYHNDEYVIMTIEASEHENLYKFPVLIDKDDYERVRKITWFRTNNYISSSKMINYVKYTTYLHQYIMNNKFDVNNYVDHINRITFDNRKENLRIATQSEQNWNQQKRKRNVILPENCGFNSDDIPTNIEYHHEYKSDIQYFEISIKMNGIRIFRKKTTKSKQVNLLHKLEEAKKILKDTMNKHPEWFEHRCMNGNLTAEGNKLYESYFEILKLANIIDPIHKYVKFEDRNKQI